MPRRDHDRVTNGQEDVCIRNQYGTLVLSCANRPYLLLLAPSIHPASLVAKTRNTGGVAIDWPATLLGKCSCIVAIPSLDLLRPPCVVGLVRLPIVDSARARK